MRAIVGLGNPGKRYELTRHNVGFMVLDKFAEKYNLSFRNTEFDYVFSEGRVDDTSDFFLVKPTTYMNMSGVAIASFMRTHNLTPEDIIVIYDDLNLEAGRIRPRRSGNDGGHNGVRSLIGQIQSEMFPRIRFGIGSKFEKGKMIDFVLSRFLDSELRLIEPQISITIELLEQFVLGGVQHMLDYYSKLANQTNSQNQIPGL
ncbi:MAG: aminoacyl-tRNA hydrolase [Ignavibacteriales bacterium]|nr:aminoacyl-tRNA hydrolase [Ignavibacteriales bacterium]OGU63762.1 MAG: aminoacyl-tRNA hydrolase [Stygiobacter sp. GWC2_38_9]OGU82720.1 MAG: aminoacyl-tRNA hydrolase [Stygiobacter sp. RIFOXYA12_FULL_38_9]OGV08113.1 MAG: aminoacyl-tRNA hydrolase [Stygiobacter sp. RIFOXYB2_FULL_37_11]OGV11887.1 MAG: aminoacyl-tRNA hydrolase [Stygiobacter sp. RIFOXYA2_FULL_38_8]OGV15629.1 MAG: aminoacyl-tRNA hydrolase [Stygiobacter sp. RIFOXYC2_FULL_38_25]OGV23963.1 MAG: aminoacyl-tRNA hydrolase [Stygiobacter s